MFDYCIVQNIIEYMWHNIMKVACVVRSDVCMGSTNNEFLFTCMLWWAFDDVACVHAQLFRYIRFQASTKLTGKSIVFGSVFGFHFYAHPIR